MRGLVTAIGVAVFGSSALASYINVISSFKGGIVEGNGYWAGLAVGYDGSYLWTTAARKLVERVYPTGSIIKTYPMYPLLALGMAYDGIYFYTTDSASREKHIFKIVPTNGSTAASWPFPPPATCSGGLAYDGSNLFFAALWLPWLWRMNTNGSILSSVNMGISMPCGLAYDNKKPGGPFIWCSDEPKERTTFIYKLTTAGSVLESAPWPIDGSNLCGLAFDGTYLWCMETKVLFLDNYLYKVLYVSDVGVAPASVGKIKALYR